MARETAGSGFWATIGGLALAVGLGLVGTGVWLEPLREGQAAAEAGRWEEALGRFAAAEGRFDRFPLSKQLLPSAYTAAQAGRLGMLYRLGERDALVEKAADALPRAPVHFWAGCAFFSRALDEEDGEARVGWLSRASEEFRKALVLTPEDWDTKYNYELSERLLAQLRKEPQKPPKELLQLLRPRPRPGQAPTRRTG